MSEWQPIETAPKDGKSVILFDPSRGGFVADQRFIFAHWSGWGGGIWENTNSGGKLMNGNPTHWMPLPEPPK